MTQQTRPKTVAKMISVALAKQRNVEVMPSDKKAIATVTEGMNMIDCKGVFIPEGENGKMYIASNF